LTVLVFVSGLLSAFLVNDTVCVMLVPFVIVMIERSDLPIRPYLFALATGASVGSVMTVVGNPQNMIIAHAAPVTSMEFFQVLAPIGMVSLGLTAAILRGIFRHDLQNGKIELRPSPAAVLDRRLLIQTLMCLVLVLVGFISGLQLAWTALGGATLLLPISGRPPR
jgi:Na+/H+ antiporter NhaD/arsenite permease-like protein